MLNANANKTGIGFRPGSSRAGSLEIPLRPGAETRFEVQIGTPRERGQAALERDAGVSGVLPDRAPAAVASVLKVDRILVPFDFSAASVRLLFWITAIAERTGARVWVVHVVSPWVPPTGREAPYNHDVNKERVEIARSLLHRLLAKGRRRDGAVFAHVSVGRPVDEIVQFSHGINAGIIVMATHGDRGLKRLFVSATTERAARRARCPVLAVPESVLTRGGADAPTAAPDESMRILMPTDFGPGSSSALRYAAAIARENGAELYVLNFSDRESRRSHAFDAARQDDREDFAAARERLNAWVRAHINPAQDVRTIVCHGKPSVYLLLRESELLKAGLIVLGSRGYAWAERLRLSSSTDAILRYAPCPVLSLRDEAKARH